MHTAKLSQPGGVTTLEHLRSWRDVHPAWSYSVVGYLALMLFCMAAELFDERMLSGVSVWTKPFKFSLSLAVYFATLVVCAKLLPRGYLATWQGRTLSAIPFLAGIGEMVYITYQAALGEPSHFNYSTPFHSMMYSLMGFGATLLVAVLVWMGWVIARANSLRDPLVLAVVLGLVLTFVLGGGFGGYLGGQGGHWVGGAQTDADALPVVKWVRDGGDLRVAHFFGMHAMQVIPLFALLLPKRLSARAGVSLVLVFSAAYTAFTTLTFIQAVRGQPFLG